MTKGRVWFFGVLCGLLFAANGAGAEGASGRAIALTCYGCHGTYGVSKGSVPSLKGRPAESLQKAMMMFKSGERPATIMDRIAKGYSDQEIAAVAEFFANLK